MENHQGRRPVKGGPAQIGRKEMAAQRHRAGGPGVPWTPGRRPPHRNGGARRLSGYAAKSRSDAPTGGAQASPFLCFRPPFRRPMQKGCGLALPLYSHERTTIIRYVVRKMATKPTRQVSNKANPARANKEKKQRARRGRVRGSPQSNRTRQGERGCGNLPAKKPAYPTRNSVGVRPYRRLNWVQNTLSEAYPTCSLMACSGRLVAFSR